MFSLFKKRAAFNDDINNSGLRLSIKTMLYVMCSCMVGACYNPINEATADRYMAYGSQNEAADNLPTACEDYRRAYINTQVGHLGDAYAAESAGAYARVKWKMGDKVEAQKSYGIAETHMKKAYDKAMSEKNIAEQSRATYNYALLERDMCHLPESEALLLKALNLEQDLQQGKTHPNMSKRLCELANFYFELRNWVKSAEYFKKCDAMMDRLQSRSAYAMRILEEYHTALVHAGERDEAAAIENKIAAYKAQGIESRSPWFHPGCAGMESGK